MQLQKSSPMHNTNSAALLALLQLKYDSKITLNNNNNNNNLFSFVYMSRQLLRFWYAC